MNRVKIIGTLLLGITLTVECWSNNTIGDTIRLEEVTISANRLINFTTGAKIQDLEPLLSGSFHTENLASVLSRVTQISVNSYGISGLSNVSMRGMGSKHTAILWNGFNLQNSMNGGFDMNNVPTFLIDDVQIQYGGSGALFGSGAVGGIIHLNNKLNLNKGLDLGINQSYGSFNNIFSGLRIGFGNHRFASILKVYKKTGENDFKYTNTQQFGNPEVRQENAAFDQAGILYSGLLKINSSQKVTMNLWYQDYYRENPPMMTNDTAASNENNQHFKLSAEWQRNSAKSSQYFRVYYSNDKILYKDPLLTSINPLDSSGLVNHLDNYSYVAEFENKLSINNHFLLNIGLNETYEAAKTYNYSGEQHRNKLALFTSLKYYNRKNTIATVFSFREELVDYDFTPLTFSLGFRYKLSTWIDINSNISKTYKLPTFNDLYWMPGGNQDLKAEYGWSEDLGFNIHYSKNKNNLKANATFFNNNIENLIIWLPTSSTYWSAENVENAWSRGIESNIEYSIAQDHLKTGFRILYSYTKSTNEKSKNGDESSFGKQLIYIPQHKGGLSVYGSYKWISLQYDHNYIGKRYITKNNDSFVDPYHVADFAIGGQFKIASNQFNVNFKINNIWNETYQVMAFYAMPLRYYSLSLTYNFNKLKN